jgi:hypothetical protein
MKGCYPCIPFPVKSCCLPPAVSILDDGKFQEEAILKVGRTICNGAKIWHSITRPFLATSCKKRVTEIDRVKEIILKKRLKLDVEVQIMENALCLVFPGYQYGGLRRKYLHDPEKMVNILYKSLLKMDAHGHAAAGLLNFTDDGLERVREAMELIKVR